MHVWSDIVVPLGGFEVKKNIRRSSSEGTGMRLVDRRSVPFPMVVIQRGSMFRQRRSASEDYFHLIDFKSPAWICHARVVMIRIDHMYSKQHNGR